ncbi:MAG TPA: acyltransferase [Rhodoferax sp.]|nr:acyltransferase [Rhodoferax sp.]HNV58842.1 acyltransferase [Rhodoferax sp.]HPW28889.1 acyltransferase [Rhodoferax sp.]
MQIRPSKQASEKDPTFLSATIPQERLLPGIHGLRGIAALAVVLYHLVHLAKIAVPEAFGFFASDFGKGVHLFFVISAFSLMYSTASTLHRQSWAVEYFVKRFFRIAPLFYCILACMILWPAIYSHAFAHSPQAILLNLTFTFGFAPWTGIVWAGWTVGVEMLFYAIFPVLLLTVRSMSATLVLLLLSVAVTYAAQSTLQTHFESHVSQYGYNWAYFSFPANLCYFVFGMLAFRMAARADKSSTTMRWLVPAFSVVTLGALMFAKPGSLLFQWKDEAIVWGLGFGSLCLWQSTRPSQWCANRFFEYLGERSYSIYLLHPIVTDLLKSTLQGMYAQLVPQVGAYAYFVCFIVLLTPLLLLAELTYRFIEVPGIAFGSSMAKKFRSQTGHAS